MTYFTQQSPPKLLLFSFPLFINCHGFYYLIFFAFYFPFLHFSRFLLSYSLTFISNSRTKNYTRHTDFTPLTYKLPHKFCANKPLLHLYGTFHGANCRLQNFSTFSILKSTFTLSFSSTLISLPLHQLFLCLPPTNPFTFFQLTIHIRSGKHQKEALNHLTLVLTIALNSHVHSKPP